MLSETLTAATPEDLLSLPLFTLVLFVAVFAGVVWRVWQRGSDDPSHAYAAGLPLASDDRLGPDTPSLDMNAPRDKNAPHDGGPDRG